MRTVILTRPTPISDDVTSFLTAHGVPHLHLPTLQVNAHIDSVFEQYLQQHWSNYHGVMLVSQHAVRFAAERLQALNLNWRDEVWAAAVGRATANAAKTTWPHAQVICPPSNDMPDSEHLWRALQLKSIDWSTQRILIVRAQTGRDTFLNLLREAGATVDVWSCYQRAPLSWSATQHHEFQSALRHSGVVLSITSQEGLAALLDNLYGLSELESTVLHQQPVLTLHPSIAAYARSRGFVNVHIAPADEAAAHLLQLAGAATAN